MNNLVNILFNENDNETYIELGSCYAVLMGDYHGEIFVFFKQIEDILMFVSLPKMILRKVKIQKFDIGLKEKILDYCDLLPKDVYKVIESHGNNIIDD